MTTLTRNRNKQLSRWNTRDNIQTSVFGQKHSKERPSHDFTYKYISSYQQYRAYSRLVYLVVEHILVNMLWDI